MTRVRSPDGREWEVRVIRVRFPRWHDSTFEPTWTLVDVVLVPFYWLVLPVARVLLAFPFVLARAAVSKRRWIEAECRWPAVILIRWKTSSERAERVAEEVTALLASGYAGLHAIAGADLESMTEPPGLHDLQA